MKKSPSDDASALISFPSRRVGFVKEGRMESNNVIQIVYSLVAGCESCRTKALPWFVCGGGACNFYNMGPYNYLGTLLSPMTQCSK